MVTATRGTMITRISAYDHPSIVPENFRPPIATEKAYL
jgi:hypothetical protein